MKTARVTDSNGTLRCAPKNQEYLYELLKSGAKIRNYVANVLKVQFLRTQDFRGKYKKSLVHAYKTLHSSKITGNKVTLVTINVNFKLLPLQPYA